MLGRYNESQLCSLPFSLLSGLSGPLKQTIMFPRCHRNACKCQARTIPDTYLSSVSKVNSGLQSPRLVKQNTSQRFLGPLRRARVQKPRLISIFTIPTYSKYSDQISWKFTVAEMMIY